MLLHKLSMPRKLLLVMKVSFILMFAIMMQVSAASLAQKVVIKKNTLTYEQLFEEIEIQTGIATLLSNRELDLNAQLVLEGEDFELGELLNEVTKDTDLTFEIIDEYIVIRPLKLEERVRVDNQNQQPDNKIVIRGTVKDEKGEPLPFAAIRIKGTTIGTVSDAEGNYNLQFEEQENVILEVSSLGFETAEIIYDGQSTINITLIESIAGIDEVVVTGYQTISKERATGSFSMLDSDNVANSPNETIGGNLESLVAGVQTTIDENGNPQFTIRGTGSLTGAQEPLIVVDGFAIDGGFESINRNDVEKITVLKDAAAASIWGARAANGVIVIVTKKGNKTRDIKISVEAYAKFSDEVDLDYANPIASSASQLQYEQWLWNNGFGSPSYDISNINSTMTKGSELFQKQLEEHIAGGGTGHPEYTLNTPEIQALMKQSYKEQVKEHMLRKAFSQNYNVSLRGQSERNQYSLSVMFNDNKQVMVEDSDNNVLINFRNNMKIRDWLDFDFAIMEQIQNNKSGGVGLRDIQGISPYETLLDDNGAYNHINTSRGLNKTIVDDLHEYVDGWSYDDMTNNPLQNMRSQDYRIKTISTRINTGLNFRIAEGIKYTFGFQYQNRSSEVKNRHQEESYYTRDLVNMYNITDYDAIAAGNPYTITDRQVQNGEVVYQYSNQYANYVFRNQFSLNKTYGEHSFNFIAGTEVNWSESESKDDWLYGYDHDKYTNAIPSNGYVNLQRAYYPAASTANLNRGGIVTYGTNRYFSLYSNIAYTYKDKYSLSGSVRTDASNLTVEDPAFRYAPFWSVGASWQLAKESFVSDIEYINRLTLRATYGANGNVPQQSAQVPIISFIPGTTPYSGAGADYAIINDLGNPTLGWEKVKQFNTAIDFALFKNKLFGSVEYYNKNSEDLVTRVSLPSTDGTSSQNFNVAKMENNGIELNLNAKLRITKGFDWRPIFNFAHNKNEVKEVKVIQIPLRDMIGTQYVENYAMHPLWAYKYNGLNDDGVATVLGKDGIVYDANNNISNTGVHGPDVTWYQGTKLAPTVTSLTNEFTYKGISLLFTITGKFGHHMYVPGFSYGWRMDKMNYHQDLDYIIAGEAEANGEFPIPTETIGNYTNYGQNARYLEARIEDASYVRFKELMLSYRLPQSVISKIGFDGIRVYTHINNIGLLWTANDKGIDPDYPMGASFFRPETTYTLGVNMTF